MEIEKFRFPGEFEPQTDVFINWLPDYCAGEDGDKGREVLVEVVKNLLGHVNVHVNCGCETSLEACKQMLADAGVDVSDPDTEGQRNTAADNGDEKFSPFIRFTHSATPPLTTGMRSSAPSSASPSSTTGACPSATTAPMS